jgi:hypothetical protein
MVVIEYKNSSRGTKGGSLKGRDGPYIAPHMCQLRIPFPDAPEMWEDWNWVYNKPEALANIDYKMRQWAKGEGGKKFKAYFGERYTMKIDIPDVGG